VNITGAQIRAARALLGLSQEDVAKRATVSVPTVKRCETDLARSPHVTEPTRLLVIAALESAGIAFTNGGEPGVKLRARRRR